MKHCKTCSCEIKECNNCIYYNHSYEPTDSLGRCTNNDTYISDIHNPIEYRPKNNIKIVHINSYCKNWSKNENMQEL